MKIIKFIFISIFTFLIISCGGSSKVICSNFFRKRIEEDLKNLGIFKSRYKANAAIFAFYKKPGEKEAIEYEII